MNFPEGGMRMGYNANGGWDYMFNIAAIENWCDNCVHAETGSVDSLVTAERVANYVAGMGRLPRYRCHLGCILLKMGASDIVVDRTV